MTYRFKKWMSSIMLVMTVSLFVFTFTANTAISSENIEEGIDTVLPNDDVITGKMDERVRRTVYVDGLGYSACQTIKVYSPGYSLIPFEDIEGAEEVKLFINNGCIRKMKVLHFAE